MLEIFKIIKTYTLSAKYESAQNEITYEFAFKNMFEPSKLMIRLSLKQDFR